MQKQVRVGVGFLIFNSDSQFLVQERQGSHGAGTWAPPGGHQEFGETVEETAAREALEETGLIIPPQNIVRLGFTDDIMRDEDKHYITLVLGAWLPEFQKPEIKEPHKASRIEWWDGKADGRKVFLSLQNFLEENPEPFRVFDARLRLAANKLG